MATTDRPLAYPNGRFAMSADQVCDELTYRNYKYNRLNTPETEPQRWAAIYGSERVTIMERRYQLDRER